MEDSKDEKRPGGGLGDIFDKVDVLKQENLDALAVGLGICAMLFSLLDLRHLGALLIAGSILFGSGVIAHAIRAH